MEKEKINTLPQKPGVYIFKNAEGEIIYIGKAGVLRNRVRSYFQEGKKDIKTEILSGLVKDLDYIVTKNEIEAFLLENSLIKQHKPHYNILLKDDKSYPFIKITTGEKYPGVYITRVTKDKNAVYYGPFMPDDAKKVVQLIYKAFRVRQCTYEFDKKPLPRPCIYYDTGVCTAPCVRFISDEAYKQSIKEVRSFLNGSYRTVRDNLQKQMDEYSEKQEYEKAAEARDAIKAVEGIMSEQKVVDAEDRNIDAIDHIYRDNVHYFCVLSIRSGRLIGKKIDVFSEAAGEEGVFELYLYQYYNRRISYPEEVILPDAGVKPEIAGEIFRNKGIKVIFKKRDNLLKMAQENIEERIKQHDKIKEQKEKSQEKSAEAIKELGENLYMKKPPLTIEGIDVSHLQGDNLVASCVVFKNGAPDKSSYRRYKVQTVTGIDDYGSISEVVKRRYSRMLKEDAKFPDLILIDGGIGQVNAAKEALSLTGIEDVEIIGLAKREELVFKPGENKPVPITEKARFLLQRVRDEAHRFALSYQTLLSNKKLKKSIFDDIPYIGEKIKYRLYNEFKDKDDLLKAIDENDPRAAFLNKRQREEIMKKLRDK